MEGEERGKKGEKETERNDGKVSERRENLRRNRRREGEKEREIRLSDE